jgi:hypothetical protein
MGLADVESSNLECDVLNPIYPDRETACAKAANAATGAATGAATTTAASAGTGV